MISMGANISFGLDELDAHREDRKEGRREKRNCGHRKDPVEVQVREVREPTIDIMEEPGYTLILADLPGIGKKDVRLALKDEILVIRATRDGKRYYKEVLLPRPHCPSQLKFSCNNGILEVRVTA